MFNCLVADIYQLQWFTACIIWFMSIWVLTLTTLKIVSKPNVRWSLTETCLCSNEHNLKTTKDIATKFVLQIFEMLWNKKMHKCHIDQKMSEWLGPYTTYQHYHHDSCNKLKHKVTIYGHYKNSHTQMIKSWRGETKIKKRRKDTRKLKKERKKGEEKNK